MVSQTDPHDFCEIRNGKMHRPPCIWKCIRDCGWPCLFELSSKWSPPNAHQCQPSCMWHHARAHAFTCANNELAIDTHALRTHNIQHSIITTFDANNCSILHWTFHQGWCKALRKKQFCECTLGKAKAKYLFDEFAVSYMVNAGRHKPIRMQKPQQPAFIIVVENVVFSFFKEWKCVFHVIPCFKQIWLLFGVTRTRWYRSAVYEHWTVFIKHKKGTTAHRQKGHTELLQPHW